MGGWVRGDGGRGEYGGLRIDASEKPVEQARLWTVV